MTTIGDLDLVQRVVARGVRILDREGPADWYNHVDLTNLDLTTGDDCILGQLWHYYHAGTPSDTNPDDGFDSFLKIYGWSVQEAANNGFLQWGYADDPNLTGRTTPIDLLTAEWTRVIQARRGEE